MNGKSTGTTIVTGASSEITEYAHTILARRALRFRVGKSALR